jgi:putative flavoprotein involved in K+ transport
MGSEEAVVLGAGFAGLGTAAMLEKRGVPTLVLERSGQVGSSWRGRYDSLKLNTPRAISTLHRYRMPRRYGRWPKRDDLVRYLEDYVRELDIRIQFDTEATRIDRVNGGWGVQTSRGPVETSHLVVATGYDREPKLPAWPGADGFTGELLHAASYRNPEPYRGRDVLVVSAGNTGSEIAFELVRNGARRVRTAVRTPPNIFPRQWLGIPLNYVAGVNERAPLSVADRGGWVLQRLIYGNLTRYGLPRAPLGFATNQKKRHVAPLIDAGFVEAVKSGEIGLVAAVEAFDGNDVVLADGTRIQPDVVIAATGYRRGLEPLVGHLGALAEEGEPIAYGAPAHPSMPGLYFVGYRVELAAQIRPSRIDGRKVARAIARERRRARTSAPAPQPAGAGAGI